MSDEHDSWVQTALGFDIARAVREIPQEVHESDISRVKELPPQVAEKMNPPVAMDQTRARRGHAPKVDAHHHDPIHPEREVPPTPQPKGPSSASMPILREGATGPAVKDLQLLLNQHGASLDADGKFGPKTTKAVKDFQAKAGLDADGVVGPNTWDALSAAKPTPPAPVPPPTPPAPVPPPSPPDTRPRAVIFTVTSEATNNAVSAATVSVAGQSEKTGNTGQATFSLAPGKYPFAVAAEGLEPFTGSFEVTTDQETGHHVELKGGGPVPPSPTGNRLRFTVLDVKASTAIRGATILIESSNGNTADFTTKSATTDGNGNAGFVLPPSSGTLTLNIRVTADKFADFRGVYKLPADGFDQEVHLKSKAAAHQINFWVFDHQLEELQGATIEIGGKRHTTNARGQADVEVQPGPQPYLVTKDGFQPFHGKVDLQADQDILEKVRMVPLAVCKVKIKVTDRDDAKKVITQAEILLDGLHPHATGGKTDDNGELVCKVPPGNHDFVATARDQGYAEGRGTFETKPGQDTDLPILMTKGGGALKSGGVFIRVLDGTTRKAIDGAAFTIGGISDTSLAGGIIDIIGLEVGRQKFTLTKTGYAKLTGTINVKEVPDPDGEGPPPQRDDVEMTPEALNDAVIRVTDGESKQPLEGASVELGSLGSKSTDANGKVAFPQVPSGTYRCRVTAKEHEPTSVEVALTGETGSSNPLDVRLLKLSPPGLTGSKIDLARLKGPIDVSKLRADLTKTASDVQTALEAEKAMHSTAKSAGINLDKPEEAAETTKFKLTREDKRELKAALLALRNTRGDMVNIAHQMQIKEDEIRALSKDLEAKFPDKLPDEFWKGLDAELAGAGEDILGLLDMGEQVISIAKDMEHGPVLAIIEGVAGSDYFKHLIHHETDKSEGLKIRIAAVAEKINVMIDKLGKATVQAVSDGQKNLENLKADYANKQKDYADNHKLYAEVVAGLSSKAGNAIPREFARTHTAVVNAALLSRTARNVLPVQFNDKSKGYLAWWKQLNPMGDLIFDGPDTGLPGSVKGNLVVYQNGRDQFAFRETRQSLQRLAQQLDPVKQLFESGRKLDLLYEKWTNALLE